MILKVLIRGKDQVGGVDEGIVDELAAVGGVEGHRGAVHPVAGSPIFVRRFAEERLAVLEGRLLHFVQRGYGQSRPVGDHTHVARIPSAAKPVQERVDTVQGAALRAAHDQQLPAGGFQDESLRAAVSRGRGAGQAAPPACSFPPGSDRPKGSPPHWRWAGERPTSSRRSLAALRRHAFPRVKPSPPGKSCKWISPASPG